MQLVLGNGEKGVFHAQRVQQPLRNEVIERLAGSHLQHPREHVEREAVNEDLPRMSRQGQLRDSLGDLFGGWIAFVDRGPRVDFSNGPFGEQVAPGGDSRRLRKQLTDLGRRLGVCKFGRIRGAANQDLHVSEFRNVLGDRILKAEPPFLHQRHGRHGEQGFGHGMQTVERVRPGRLALIDVSPANGFEVRELAETGNGDGRSGDLPGLDHCLRVVGKSSQALAR